MKDLKSLISSEIEFFINLRHDIHQHPELAFSEKRTSDLVADLLTQWGYQVERNIGGTGLVAQLKLGSNTSSIGIRADMDALPILEETKLPYVSVNNGVMHACGHDGHTVMLLAAAKAIAARKLFNGTVHLIFQPAEEYGKADSGAARMIADGLFSKYPCDVIYGMHNMPGFAEGQLLFCNGPMMSSSDSAVITLTGVGGHGAQPQKAKDPIVAAASIIMALQTIVSRNVNPLDTALVTVGMIQAGVANNVIPEKASMQLTIRCFKPEVKDLLEKRITDLVHAQAASFGVSAQVEYQRSYPPLHNDEKATQFARDVARSVLPEDKIVDQTIPMTASEDFSFMLEQCPGAYIFIGNGINTSSSCALHNAEYDFNDTNIAVGATYWTALVEQYLK